MNFNGQRVLVTGGAGYIGSHTVIRLLNAGALVTVLDTLENSKRNVIDKIGIITGQSPEFFEGDIRDRNLLRLLFDSLRIDSVIHFAGLKSVGESTLNPLRYYEYNVAGSIVLIDEMRRAGIKSLVFSSSAAVYGESAVGPISEDFPLQPSNPYGRSKLMVEEVLRDLRASDDSWRIALLRYFNPVGAHESGLIGEDPNGVPNNLMPFMAQVAAGLRPLLKVYGGDYDTLDGTGVRDYIHVDDLAAGHLCALNVLSNQKQLVTVNLGTGRGHSVLEMIRTFERATNKSVPFEIVDRRAGDIAACYANPIIANKLLGWTARHDAIKMCIDLWRWQTQSVITTASN